MTSVAKHKLTPRGRMRSVATRRGMNGLETRYSQYLELLRKNGKIEWWGYCEWKFRLADGAHYTPDFAVMDAAGFWEIHECKGNLFREAAKVRTKVTSSLYWMFPVKLIRETKTGWDITALGEGV